MRSLSVRSVIAGTAIAGWLLFTLSASVLAQDATPAGTPAVTPALPAHIHEGTCDALGAIVFPLNDVTVPPAADMVATPPARPAMVHAEEVLSSVTVVDVSLTDLLAGHYVINIHGGAEDLQTSFACGEIVGLPRLHLRSDAPPGLVIPLRELNDSGYAGVAWLEPTPDGKTRVTIFLAAGLIGRGPRP
jgi:hypothetical protein